LRKLVAEFGEYTATRARLHVEGDRIELGAEARLALYRTGQEALTNVRRHTRASGADRRQPAGRADTDWLSGSPVGAG